MVKEQVDPGDLLFLPFFVAGSWVSLGLVNTMPVPIIGDLSATLVVLPGDTIISWASALSLAAFTGVVLTNDYPIRREGERAWTLVNLYLIYATYMLILGPPLVPLIDALINNSTAALVGFLVQTAGYFAASYSA